MKKILLTFALFGLLVAQPVIQTSCKTPIDQRYEAAQTLRISGHTAEGLVAISAQLYAAKHISAEQARSVMDFYDNKWQPAYQLAVVAAQSDLSTYSSPSILALLAQLSALVTPPQSS